MFTDPALAGSRVGFESNVVQLHQVLAVKVNREHAVDTLTKFGLIPASNSPAEFTRFIDSEIARWEKAVQASGAKNAALLQGEAANTIAEMVLKRADEVTSRDSAAYRTALAAVTPADVQRVAAQVFDPSRVLG